MKPEYISKRIKSIKFGIFSPKQIKKMAVAKIVTAELYDREGYPVDGGLMDTRLGVIDPGLVCRTDGQKLKESLGHFGYIELARPVLHIKYIPLIATLLKCTCKDCGKVLIPQNKKDKYVEVLDGIEEEYGLEGRRKYIKKIVADLKTVTKCPHCKARQQKITLEKPYTFLEGDKRVSSIEIRTRFEKISDEDCAMFGMNTEAVRPEWLVLTVLSIPPVTMRPSITLESGERSEDDLTHKLGDILRINQRLFENINAGAPEIIIEDLWDLLQYHITTFYDNAVAQLPPARHRSGQPLKTITERIKSKEGRIRHNLAGKRTNFSARTVISPDPMIELNELGIPMEVATKLTVPERITEWNFEYLKKFVERGSNEYPGSNYVVRPDGTKKRITDDMKEQILEELQPGYQVERHLMDGDIAIFNRQPSLHRMSMMCHKIKVLPGKTFRLNPCVCNPYNADFDGDEMNLHIPQTEEARAEAEILMQVQTQLISPRYGLAVIGIIQDAISGNYLLTKDNVEFTKESAVDMLIKIGMTEFENFPDKKLFSGKDVFSMLLPEDFNFIGMDKAGNEVIIEKGILKTGVMDSANLGQGAGLMLRNIHKKYGESFTADMLGKILKLGLEMLKKNGFSTAISDMDLPPEAVKAIDQIQKEAAATVKEHIKQHEEGTLQAFTGKTLSETVELKILQALDGARNKSGEIVNTCSLKETGTIAMIRSGGRGKNLNLAQMAGCVGQQAMRGKRIDLGYHGRTLSHFKEGDLSPEARGFIKGGFKQGLSPAEVFFMGMTGRDALMDTALRTPKSGYLYRRLANALQDLKVEYDYTVRDASKIVQFMYGEDGIDVSRSEGGTINVKKIVQEYL